jgi:hypothetical protein
MRLNDFTRPYQPRHLATEPSEALLASQNRRARDICVVDLGQAAYDELAFATSVRGFPQHRCDEPGSWALNVIRGGCEKHHWRGATA